MKTKLLLLLLLLSFSISYSQVSMGHHNPAPSAVLDITLVGFDGVTVIPKGMLVPRMTTAQRDAIVNPATGLIIYNTETNCYEFFLGVGNSWYNFCNGNGGDDSSNGTAIVDGYDCQNGVAGADTGRLIAESKVLDNVTHTIKASVAKGGSYSISAAVNGTVFAASGTYIDPSDPAYKLEQDVILKATGEPSFKGIYTFNLNTVPDCSFNRDVFEASSGGTSIVNTWDCAGASAGTLTAGRTIGTDSLSVVSQAIIANVAKVGSYYIEFPTTNGVVFKAEGNFDSVGQNEVVLVASGIPLEIDPATTFNLPLIPTCSFAREVLINPTSNGTAEVSAYVVTSQTKGKLQFGKEIAEGEVSHTIMATVVNAGKYNIATDTANGATFAASGTFAATGEQPVELFALGKPHIIGDFDYTTNTTPPFCTITRATLGNDSSGGTSEISSFVCDAEGAGQGKGSLIKDIEILDGEVTQIVKVNVTTAGSYDISTDTVNGVTFSAKGTFNTIGTLQTLTLKASGTPTASSVDAIGVLFTITTKPNCSFNRVIFEKNSSGGTSTVTAYDCVSGANTGNIYVNRLIDKATTDISKTIKVTVGTAGTYYIRATKGGVVFSAEGVFSVADIANSPIDVLLKAHGEATSISASETFTLDVVDPDPAVTLACSYEREFEVNPSSNGSADVTSYLCKGKGTGSTGLITATKEIVEGTGDANVTQTVIVDVRVLGTYDISITNDNASTGVDSRIVFAARGSFTEIGMHPLVLRAKPTATLTPPTPPTFNLALDAESNAPTFTIKPIPTSDSEYTYCAFRRLILDSDTGGTSKVSDFSCGDTSVANGVLINGVDIAPATDSITQTIYANVEIPGVYNLVSVEKGITFKASGIFTATGNNPVVLVATGKPAISVIAAPPYSTPVDFKLYPYKPACVSCEPSRPADSPPITTGEDLGCVFNRSIAEPVHITVQPASTNVCAGKGTREISVDVTGGGTITYQWKRNGTNVGSGGAISINSTAYKSTIKFTNPLVADAGAFTCEIGNGGVPVLSNAATLTVNPLPTLASVPTEPSALAKCGDAFFPLVATADNGTTGTKYDLMVNWYDGTGVTLLESLSSGTAFITPVIPAQGSLLYKIEAYNTVTQCASATLTDVTVTANKIPEVSINATAQRCGLGDVLLTANVGADTDVIAKWYDTDTTTTERADAATVKFPTSTGVKTIYVSAYNSVSSCESSRKSVTVTAHNAPTGITLNSSITMKSCGAAKFMLNATALGAGATPKVRWYYNGVVVSGEVLSGSDYETPSLAVNATNYIYSVDAYDPATKCASTVTKPTVTISVHQVPTIISAPAVSYCKNNTGTVVATAGNGGNQVRWYSVPTNGTIDFTTDAGVARNSSLTASTTYYVTGYNSTTLCESPTRTSVAVTVNDIPLAPAAINNVRCGNGAVSISVTASTGNDTSWYAAATGGVALATGNIYSPSVSATTTFYAEFKTTATGCVSTILYPRTAVVATVNTLPTINFTSSWSVCAGASVSIPFTTTNADQIRKYTFGTNTIGGTITALPYTRAYTPTNTQNDDWTAYNSTTGCESAKRNLVVTYNTVPTINFTSAWAVCAGASVSIPFTTTDANQIRKYTIGTNSITGTITTLPYTRAYTPTNTQNDDWTAYNSTTGCESAKRNLVVSYNTIPTINAFAQTPSVCYGTAFNQTITATGGDKVRYYVPAATASSGALASPTNWGTATVTATHDWEWTAYNSTTGCESAKRRLTLTANPIPTINAFAQAPSVCYGTSFYQTITATGGDKVRYYVPAATASSGALASPANWGTATVTATHDWDWTAYNSTTGCESAKRRLTLTANPLPETPVAVAQSPLSVCGSGSATVGVTPVTGVSMYWYTNADVPISATPSNSYTTPVLTITTIYKVQARTAAGCNSATKASVTAAVGATPTINAFAQTPSVCSGTPFNQTFTATGGDKIKYYTPGTNTSGALQNSPCNWTVGSVTTTQDWEWAALNSTTGCESARRRITVTANPLPAVPTVTSASICGSGVVNLAATQAGCYIDWYTASTGGTAFLTSGTYGPNLSSTTSYYVASRNTSTGCVSTTRATVTGTIYPIPSAPTAATAQGRCGTGTLSISATPSGGAPIEWYSAATGGTYLGTSNSYVTPSISTSTTYYAGSKTAAPSNCTSAARLAVVATINPLPTVPDIGNNKVCYPSQTTITLTTISAPAGVTTRWYSVPTGGALLGTGNSFTTPLITVNTSVVYYVEAMLTPAIGSPCISNSRGSVTASVVEGPTPTLAVAGNILTSPTSDDKPFLVQIISLPSTEVLIRPDACYRTSSELIRLTTDAKGRASYMDKAEFYYDSGRAIDTNLPHCNYDCFSYTIKGY